jgi:hypothetical protein
MILLAGYLKVCENGIFLFIALVVVLHDEFIQGWVTDLLAIIVAATNPQEHPRKRLAVMTI